MVIREELLSLQDVKYRDFQSKLIPTVPPDSFIGVRTPELRYLAKRLSGTEAGESFLRSLPHGLFDENQLHAFLICEKRDFDECLALVKEFLPFVDNWATCDQLSPRAFRKNPEALLPDIYCWVSSGETYTVRFGVKMLMDLFLDDRFDSKYTDTVAGIVSDEYYVNMMAAWYFATALAKQYDSAVKYIESRRLPVWTHNKAISKACESYRVPEEHKAYLRTLRIK